MKILLANLPWKKGGFWGVRAGSRWPHIKTVQEKRYLPFPFFLAYAGSLLEREGFDVQLIDSLALELSVGDFLKAVSQENPDLIVAETSTPSLWNDLNILKKIPEDIPVALCGPETSIRDPEFLSKYKFIRYVFTGEYEFTLLELVQRLEAKKILSGLRGLIYRDNGEFKLNPARPLLEDLDDLPWPLRSSLPMEKYNDAPGGIPLPSVQMWSSRGCPYQCLFCVWPQLMYQSNRYRVRSVVKVVDEMEYLVKQMGFKSVYFDDDTTNIGKLRMMEFAGEIKRRDLNIPWAMMARADLMEEDILERLHSAGLFAVKYGVESSNQELLNRIRKSMDLRKTERMIRFTKSLGIKMHLTFSFGLPGETQETIRKTLDFAKALDPDTVQFSIATAFPGTSYFQTLEQKGQIISRDFSDYDGNFKSMLCTDSLSSQDLQKAKRRADRVWRAHVWRTRCRHLRFADYLQKFKNRIQNYGPYLLFSKIFFPLYLLGDSLWMKFYGVLRGGIERTKQQLLKAKKINIERAKDPGIEDMKVVCAPPPSRFKILFETLGIQGEKIKPHLDNIKPRFKKIKGNFQKTKKHCLNILGVFNGSYAFKGPDCVQIDLTSNCNNNCVSCWCNSPLLEERAYRGSKKYKTLPTQLVKTVIDDLAGMGTNELFFSGGGEPFMHPDILSVVEHAKGHGLHCTINTNFTLIKEATVRRLIELSVDALTVSVWAATPETYALTHPNKDEATFHRLRDTLKMLNSLKNQGRPFIKIYNVISNLNYREVEPMVEFAEETGSEAVEFTVVDTIPGATDKLALDQGQRREVLAQCERILKRHNKTQVLGLEHFMRRLSDACADQAQYDSGLLEKYSCYAGWVFSRIMPDGDVNFCLKAHRIPVGNLYKSSFREIWNSEIQREFREKALKFNKNDSFFQSIGNDEDCKMGCYKSCDDIGRNMNVQRHLDGLRPIPKAVLKFIAKKVYKNGLLR